MFTRIITRKNGRQYLYLEERYREGGKVRSRSRCLGPVGGEVQQQGWLRRQFTETHGLDWDKIMREEGERNEKERADAKARFGQFARDIGLTMQPGSDPPVPEEKPPNTEHDKIFFGERASKTNTSQADTPQAPEAAPAAPAPDTTAEAAPETAPDGL